MTVEKPLLTADDLFWLPDNAMRHELVKGELRTMPPASYGHGRVAGELFRLIANHVEAHQLGDTLAAETGFVIGRDPDTVRAADVAFVTARRVPEEPFAVSFAHLAPDLVAEVVSPSQTAKEIEEKAADWLQAGVRLVWVIYPSTRSVTVYRSLSDVRILTENDHLDGEDVLPGFSCRVGDLFPY